ncbi:MAG: hypothetical protein M1829_000815 [Trizodia sp. TS-e1964]|nr:MAG: hypothetical protein M1829_000815 [Trizodia sp. TS-e1964]
MEKTEGQVADEVVNGSSNPKAELKQKSAGETTNKKAKCDKTGHAKGCKGKGKGKGKANAEESESESSDSDSDSDSDSSSDSSDEEDEDDSDDSDDSDSDSDDADKKRRRKRKARKAAPPKKARKGKARKKGKSKKVVDTSDESTEESATEEEDEPSDDPAEIQAQFTSARATRHSLRGSRSRGGLRASRSNRSINNIIHTKSKKKPKDPKKKKLKDLKKKKSKDLKKKKRASKLEYKRVDQLWDSTIHNYKLTDTAEDEDADEYDQYIFTVRRKFDWEGKYTDTVIDIKSKWLKEALNEVMDGVKGVSLVEETPVVDPNMLFLYLEELRAKMKELKTERKTQKKKKAKKLTTQKIAHIKVLIKYLDLDYKETKKTLYPLLESNLITFDLLWALFKPNTIAYTPTYGNTDEPRAFKIEYATKESSFMKGQWYAIEGRYLEYDGKSFGMGTLDVQVESFKGARKITSLACYPFHYHKDKDVLREKLIERGRKFVALKGMNYRFHKGMAFYKKKRSIIKVNINGRIMVDPAIHRRINPNYPISTVKPKDPNEIESSDDEDSDDDSCGCGGEKSDDEEGQKNGVGGGLGDEEEKEKIKLKLVLDEAGKGHIVEVKVDADGEEVQVEKIEKINEDDEDKKETTFSDEDLLVASPVVLGFAFSEKLWLEFTVSGVNEIDWNEGAFDSLVLPENQKSIVRALVESHTFHAAENIDDVIQGKGRGLVAVLHGPPGTGKTLTAEGIAELLKCPLYMVSAGELGTDPRTLEAELNKILDIAHSWGAVLLLDEADVFLEKRTIQDIHRNALVSIFLRLLEYFQGILFLTTNRVETFDDAFQSRIHVALRYGELTTKAKKTVWTMFLDRVRAMQEVETTMFKDSDYDDLAKHNLNGRQIKNCVRTAQALAVNEKKALSMEHIKRVLLVAESFDRDLKGGTGYLDAMRSYH